MTRQTDLLVGELEFKDALTLPDEETEELISHLDREIHALGGASGSRALSCEKLQLRGLRERRAKLAYPSLNPSFLSTGIKVPAKITYGHGEEEITLPRFSVYLPFVDGGNNFKVEIGYGGEREIPKIFFRYSDGLLPDEILDVNLVRSSGLDNLCVLHWTDTEVGGKKFLRFMNDESKKTARGWPSIFTNGKYPIESEHFEDFKRAVEPYEHTSKRITWGETTIWQSSLNCLVPERTKQRMNWARDNLFGDEGVVLIAETKPEEWNVKNKVYNTDPLAVGVLNNRLYLIDAFNPTRLESETVSEFSIEYIRRK